LPCRIARSPESFAEPLGETKHLLLAHPPQKPRKKSAKETARAPKGCGLFLKFHKRAKPQQVLRFFCAFNNQEYGKKQDNQHKHENILSIHNPSAPAFE
jgi:hypothetical protein